MLFIKFEMNKHSLHESLRNRFVANIVCMMNQSSFIPGGTEKHILSKTEQTSVLSYSVFFSVNEFEMGDNTETDPSPSFLLVHHLMHLENPNPGEPKSSSLDLSPQPRRYEPPLIHQRQRRLVSSSGS